MNARKLCMFLVALALLAAQSLFASAQPYSIRVKVNANIRAQPSLSGAWLVSVPAGTVLEVTGEYNRWLRINRGGGDAWMASWVRHERVATTAAPQPEVDNCCGIDRLCQSEPEWIAGWYAFQAGECQAPATSVSPAVHHSAATSGQPVVPVSGAAPLASIDNCCHLDRSCHSDEEWRAGYAAFQALECWDAYVQWKRTPDPRYMPASGSDNCCTAPGWLCLEAQHFQAGAWAFQEYKHCAPNVKTTYLPRLDSYVNRDDNCCHYGWNCQSDQNWVDGYHAYRANQCPPPQAPASVAAGIPIYGPADYVADTLRGFQWLLTYAPQWHNYVTDAITAITMVSCTGGAHVNVVNGAVTTMDWRDPKTDSCAPAPGVYGYRRYATIAMFLVHEACHVHAFRRGGHDPCHDDWVDFGIEEALNDIDVYGYFRKYY